MRILLIVSLALLMPSFVFAYNDEARWMDKTLSEPLRQKLIAPGTWRKTARDLNGFTPAPAQPLTLKFTCAAKLDSAFTRELENRGAKIIGNKECARILVFAAEGSSGVNYTFAELQKKFAPVESEAEAASFLVASGFTTNNSWYGATIDGKIYVMAVDSTCKGLGNNRTVFEILSDGTPRRVATIRQPPPNGAACPGGNF